MSDPSIGFSYADGNRATSGFKINKRWEGSPRTTKCENRLALSACGKGTKRRDLRKRPYPTLPVFFALALTFWLNDDPTPRELSRGHPGAGIMADDIQDPASDRPIGATITRGFISGSLMILTAVVSFVAVIVLSCTLTQGRMSSLSVDGVSLSVWKLDAIHEDWLSLRQEIKEEQLALTEAQLKLIEMNSAKSATAEQSKSAQTALLTVLEHANFLLRPIDKSLADDLSGKGATEQVSHLQTASDQLLKEHPELKPLLDEIAADYKAYVPAHDKAASARLESEAALATVNEIQDQTNKSNLQLDRLFDSVTSNKSKLDAAGRAKIENALFEITPIPGHIGTFMHHLIIFPPEVLALSLVILMGILGSLLQIVHSFFRKDVEGPEGFGIYFVRIAAGGVTALVIFIVAKAGIPIVADASRLGGDAPISPYFISFLAIISGLLSEQAIASVEAKGAQFFPANPAIDTQRWARDDLTQIASSNGNSVAELAGFLDLDPKAAADILDGSEPATGAQQRTIATYLHGSVRGFFTDIAPEGKSDDATPAAKQAGTPAEQPAPAPVTKNPDPAQKTPDAAPTNPDPL
jgi:hypothetical protein